jgi:hypothetical protein
MFSCNQSSNKEVKENLSEAKTELRDAKVNESQAAKAKEIAE